MAFVYVDFNARCNLSVDVCDNIYLCLVDPWKDRTQSGYPYVAARVVRIDQLCDETVITNCCSTTTTCEEYCKYKLEINSDDFIQNPTTLTSWAYDLTGDYIGEMIPYYCFVSKLMEYIDTLPDHVLDYANVAIAADAGNNLSTVSLPVIDRVNNVAIGTGTFVIPGGTLLGDLPSSVAAYTSSAGKTYTIDIGDLFESQIDGTTITRDAGTGIYSASAVIPDLTLGAYVNNCSSQGASGYLISSLSVSGHQITATRYPEHYSICETARFAALQYATTLEVATLQTGDSNVQTPAYVTTTVNNPSSCRDMRVEIKLTGSFAGNSQSGTGFVVFGHTLWVNGVKISDRNGRSNAGFTIYCIRTTLIC